MYSNEAAFSKALTVKLTKAGYSVTRIESHSTGNGIPDMFVQGHGKDFWVELKNSTKCHNKNCVTVSWRPGQQSWSLEYYRFHAHKKQTITLMSDPCGLFIIPMRSYFPRNIVNNPWYMSYEEITCYHISTTDLIKLFTFATHNLDYSSAKTYREAIITWVNNYYPDDYDFDPEVIWPHENISIDSPCDQELMFYTQFNLWRNLG